MKQIGILFILLFICYSHLIGQCDSVKCGCENEIDLSPAAISVSHLHKVQGWMVSYSYMNLSMSDNFSGTTRVADQDIFNKYLMSPLKMRMDMHMLMCMFGLTDRLSLMLMFNYNYMTMDMKMLTGQTNMRNMMGMGQATMVMKSSSQGLGDTKISGLYRILSTNDYTLLANVGLSVPTGSIGKTVKNDMGLNYQKMPYIMQLGSGTFDLLPVLTFLSEQKTHVYGVQALSVIHPHFNGQGYKLGDQYTLNTWAAYRWWQTISVSLRLNYNLIGQINGFDANIPALLEPAADPKNYGGNFINTFVGFAWFFRDDLLQNSKIAAEFGIPVYQNFNGIQSSTHYNLSIFYSLMF